MGDNSAERMEKDKSTQQTEEWKNGEGEMF
jgi:hypothetical protein